MIIFRTTAALLSVLGAGVCSAAPPAAKADWGNLKTLAPGAEIQITVTGRPKAFPGFFQGVTDDALTVGTASGQEMLARPTVTKVALKGKNHRLRNTLLGLGIGAGTGLAVGAVVDSSSGCKGSGWCFNFLPNIGKEALTPFGALLGAAVGALIHTGGGHEVYRSP